MDKRLFKEIKRTDEKKIEDMLLQYIKTARKSFKCDIWQESLAGQNTTHPRVCGLQYPPKVDISNQHNPQGWAYRWHCGSSAFRPDAISAPTTVPGNPSGSPRFRDT